MMIEITKALLPDAEEIAKIYRSLIGSDGCTWDENYPTLEFVKNDIAKNSLYKAVKDGKIIAAAYLGDYEESKWIECFANGFKNMGEVSRVGVRREFQGAGVGKTLIEYLLSQAEKSPYDGLGLLCGAENYSAMRLYEKCGFMRCGESFLYETHWICYCIKL